MRETLVVWAVVAAVVPFIPITAQSQNSLFRVALLGTGTPNPSPERLGPGTLVEARVEKLIFDVGRGVVIRLEQLGIPYAAITGIWLTHLHSDHVSGLPDLWLTGRFGAGRPPRETAVDVWGPAGTDWMVTRRKREPFSPQCGQSWPCIPTSSRSGCPMTNSSPERARLTPDLSWLVQTSCPSMSATQSPSRRWRRSDGNRTVRLERSSQLDQTV